MAPKEEVVAPKEVAADDLTEEVGEKLAANASDSVSMRILSCVRVVAAADVPVPLAPMS